MGTSAGNGPCTLGTDGLKMGPTLGVGSPEAAGKGRSEPGTGAKTR